MSKSKCPSCGSQTFYVRDPDYRYEIFEFDLQEGKGAVQARRGGRLSTARYRGRY